MSFSKHKEYLKQVFFHSITAFGGPQGHIGMILKRFVEQKSLITEAELFDYNNFCQLLPGPSSTQLITLIGYKKGGIPLALVTLLIWIFPACFIMGMLSFYFSHSNPLHDSLKIFRFIQPMAIGFLLYASIRAYNNYIQNIITHIIMIFSGIFIFLFIKNPWIIPILFISGGMITNFSKKRFPKTLQYQPIKFKWNFLILFIFLFISLGFLSETARKNQWNNKNLINLSEHNYRFGSIVFGGGDVLLPMMLDQYVERPNSKKIQEKNPTVIKIEKQALLTGYGIVKAIPGPVFSISAYIGGMAQKNNGFIQQLLGVIISALFIFLPGTLLLFFTFPVWESLKQNVFLYRSLEGIGSVTVGLLFGTFVYLIKDYFLYSVPSDGYISLLLIPLVFVMISKTKIPYPVIVLCCLFLGWFL